MFSRSNTSRVDKEGVTETQDSENAKPEGESQKPEKVVESKAVVRNSSKKVLANATKETNALTQNSANRAAAGPQEKPAVRKTSTKVELSPEARELEQLRKQLTSEEKLRISAEAKAAEQSSAKKWASEA